MAKRGVVQRRDTDYAQTGIWEELLCGACEDLFNERWDKYGIEVFRRLVERVETARPRTTVTLTNVDHPRFRLFQLSILWRAAVSSHEMFRTVRLGPHEDRLHTILDRNDAAESGKYPCYISGYVPSSESFGLIATPTMGRHAGHRTVDFLLPRMRWRFMVSSHVPLGFAQIVNSPSEIRVWVGGKSEDELFDEVAGFVDRTRAARPARTPDASRGHDPDE